MFSQNSDMPVTPMSPGVSNRKPKHDRTVMQVSEITIEAGTKLRPSHTHDISEIFYVAKGKLSVKLGDEEATMEEGCYFYIPAGTPHDFKEIIEKTVLVNVTTPEKAHGQKHT